MTPSIDCYMVWAVPKPFTRSENLRSPVLEDEIDELWNTFGTTVKALKHLLLQLPSMQGGRDFFGCWAQDVPFLGSLLRVS